MSIKIHVLQQLWKLFQLVYAYFCSAWTTLEPNILFISTSGFRFLKDQKWFIYQSSSKSYTILYIFHIMNYVYYNDYHSFFYNKCTYIKWCCFTHMFYVKNSTLCKDTVLEQNWINSMFVFIFAFLISDWMSSVSASSSIQCNPSWEANQFSSEMWPFKRGSFLSGVEINTFMFRFTLSSGLSRGVCLTLVWPFKRVTTVLYCIVRMLIFHTVIINLIYTWTLCIFQILK